MGLAHPVPDRLRAGAVSLISAPGSPRNPAFSRVAAKKEVAHSPVLESLSTHRLPVLAAFGLSAIGTVANYTYNIYLPTMATQKLGIAAGTAYTSATMAAIVLTVLTPVMGWLSDKTGRKSILLVARQWPTACCPIRRSAS